MNSYKRAFLYVVRKKGKSLTFFLLLLLVTVSIMTGISIQDGTRKAAKSLRETIGASFTMSGNISELKFDGKEEEYTTNKIPVPLQAVTQILKVDGIKAYNAEQHMAVYVDNMAYLSGMPSGTISANTDTACQTEFVSGVLSLSGGRHIREEDTDVALVSDKLAKENNLKVGDNLCLKSNPDDKHQMEVQIVGIYTSDSKMEHDDDTIFTPQNVFWKLSGQEEASYSGNVTFYVTDPEKLNYIVTQVKQIKSIKWEDYFIQINESEYQAIAYQLQTLERLTRILIFAIIIVSVVITILVLTMRVRNRIHETGILLSVGTSSAEIIGQHIFEALVITIPIFLISPILEIFVVSQVEIALKSMGNTVALSVSPAMIAFQFILEILVIILAVFAASVPIIRMKPKDILSKMS